MSTLEFCVRVDVKEGIVSKSLLETKVMIDLKLTADYEKGGIKVIGAPEDHEQVTSQFATTAWKCHYNYSLDPTPLAADKPLQLCVRSNSPAAKILGVEGLTCQQETTPGSYYTVVSMDDGEVIDPDMTQVAYPSLSTFGQIAVIKMHAASTFFEGPDPSDMFAFGSVTLQLVGTRRRLRAEFQVARYLGPDETAGFATFISVERCCSASTIKGTVAFFAGLLAFLIV